MYEDINKLRDEFNAYVESTDARLKTLEEQRRQTENGTLVLSYPPTRQDRKVILEVAGSGTTTQTVYAGRVNSDGTANGLPTGWTSSRLVTGLYRITHNLGVDNVAVVEVYGRSNPYPMTAIVTSDWNFIWVDIQDGSGGVDAAFGFILTLK